jgi:hypothetical protein
MPILTPFIVLSALVTVFGTITNLLSLSYFVTQRKSSERLSATEAINKRLFILLNSFDILVSFSLSGLLVITFLEAPFQVHIVILRVFLFLVQCTGFITCVLSVIRAISIILPLHNVSSKVVVVVSVCFGVIEIISRVLPLDRKVKATKDFAVLIGLFFTVIFSNIFCIATLVGSKLVSWKREATITMGILSFLYCVFNIGFLVVTGLSVYKCEFKSCNHHVFEQTSFYVLLPLNSASNPLIYFMRNADMRKYLKKVWRRAVGPCRISEDREEQDVTAEQITGI